MVDTQHDIAAVMFTDMRGFTALMQSDEELTLELLDVQRRLAEPLLDKHRGRLIKTIGDAFMVEFRSAVDAVRCAIALQQALHDHNAPVPADRQAHIRIGLHMGDVVRSGDDLLGDTVNIAARVEPWAEADGVSMTQAVYEQVRNRVEQTIESQGLVQLKGVTGDTPLYRVMLPWSAAAAAPASASRTSNRRRWVLTGATLSAALVVGAVAVTMWNARTSRPEPTAKVTTAPAPVGDSKSVAVLPFENLSGRAEDAYLADGLQEEILNALARLRDLKVISRTSVAEFRGKTHNIREIGERLGVGTVLEGSIRREGNKLRLTVQLIDAHDDRHLLAANYDREVTNVLDLESTVARLVADALAATLTRHERGELDRVATNRGDAYDLYLRAVALYRKPVPGDDEGLIAPKRLLEEALRIDPDYTDALALLSQANTWAYFVAERPPDGAAAKQALERALALEPDLPEAKLARGLYTMYVDKDPDHAVPDLEAVVQLRPSAAEAHAAIGFALRRRGRCEEALQHLIRASDLDPLNEPYAHAAIVTLSGLRRFKEAIERTEIYTTRLPNSPDSYFTRGRIEARLQRSVEPLRVALRDHGILLDPGDHKVVEAEIAEAEGRYLDAVRLWDVVPLADPLQRGALIGALYLAAGDTASAERTFRGAERFALQRQRQSEGVDLRTLAIVQSMLGEHATALVTIEAERTRTPEARDAANGPYVSLLRSVILVRSGRGEEGYAEAARLLRVPFGAMLEPFSPLRLLLKDDPHFDELLNHPPRL